MRYYQTLKDEQPSNSLGDIVGNKQDVAEKIIIPFLDWVHNDALYPAKTTSKAMIAGLSGFTIGAIGMYHTGVLGYDFGGIVANLFRIRNTNFLRAVSWFFAIDAILPMIALSGMATKKHFQQIISRTDDKQEITKNNRKLIRKGLIAIAYLLGIFAAITPAYVTYTVLIDSPVWLQIFMAIPAYIGGFMFKIEAEKNLLNKALNSLSKGETIQIKEMRKNLLQDLSTIVQIINEISDEELDSLFEKVLGKSTKKIEINDSRHSTLTKLKLLIAQTKSKTIQQESWCGFFGRVSASALGLLTGAISAYTYYTLGQGAALLFCNWIGIKDEETQNIIANMVGSVVVIPWGALGAESTEIAFSNIYKHLTDKNRAPQEKSCGRKFISGFSLFEGISAAIPITYLAIQATESFSPVAQAGLLIPTFLGPACVRSRAMETLLNQFADWLNNQNEENVTVKHERLINALTKIYNAIEQLPDQKLIAIYQKIYHEEPAAWKDLTNSQDDEQKHLLSLTFNNL